MDRVRKLLRELQETEGGRDACFVCALALAQRGSVLFEAEAGCHGVIIGEPRGDRGFGYDPVFYLPEVGLTYAELSEEEKNRRSHRALALERLLLQIRASC